MNNSDKELKKKSKKNLIYKIILFLFAGLLFILPTNLSALPDTDLRALVSLVGLDISGDSVVSSALVILPLNNQSVLGDVQGEGENIAESLVSLSINLGRKLEFGQCELVVIGEKLAKSGNYSGLEYLLSSGIIGAEAAVLYTQNINEFIKNAILLEDNSTTGLNSFIMFSRKNIYAPSNTLLDVLSSLKSYSQATFVPQVKISSTNNKAKIDSIDTAVVLDFNNEFITLKNNVTKGITWLDRQSKSGQVQLEDFEYKTIKVKSAPANLKNKKAVMTAKIIDGKPLLKIKINASFALTDSFMLSDKNYTPKEVGVALEEQFGYKIKTEINSAINFSQQSNVDFLGIKEEFYRKVPKDLKAYCGNVLQDLKIEYDIKVRVK